MPCPHPLTVSSWMPMEYGSIDGIIWITIGLGVTAQAKSIYSLGIQVADGRWV